jgi:chromosome segregation ATPase
MAAADEAVAKLEDAGVELQNTVKSGVEGYEQEIADLTDALEQAETQGGISAAQLEETQRELTDTQAKLESTKADLMSTTSDLTGAQDEVAKTQADLDDANAKLEQLGELVCRTAATRAPSSRSESTRPRPSCSRTGRPGGWRRSGPT